VISTILFKWIREYIKKYSFVEKTEFKKMSLFIYYKKDDELLYKKLPYRANKIQVEQTIERIKQDIDYYKKKAEMAKIINIEIKKDKPIIFANTERRKT